MRRHGDELDDVSTTVDDADAVEGAIAPVVALFDTETLLATG